MRPRSAFRDRLEYVPALIALKSLELAPLPIAHRLARAYTRLLDLAIPRLRRTAEYNLAMTMPERDPRPIIDGVFRSIARLLVTFSRFPTIHRDNIAQWIRCEGAEHYENALKGGRGVLFATAHLGNWELSAFAHAILTAPMHVVVRPLDNSLIDALVERRRRLSGNWLISKTDAARTILRALRKNEAVGILVDQNATPDNGLFVNFFGTPACANVGFAKLAAASGAAVIPGFALWSEAEQRYVLRFYPPVAITGDAARDTQEIQAKLEEVIRAYPDQWLWIHRRWKTRPAGQPALYEASRGARQPL
jgi:KDO2-lipid IV(A) lauroyltransferase